MRRNASASAGDRPPSIRTSPAPPRFGASASAQSPGGCSTRSKGEFCGMRCEVCHRGLDVKCLQPGWASCSACGVMVHVECYDDKLLLAGKYWQCERCLHGTPNLRCQVCDGSQGALKRVQGTGVHTMPAEVQVKCNEQVAMLLLGPPVMVRTHDDRVITPNAFVREAGSKLRSWRQALIDTSAAQPVWQRMEGQWAHVRCTALVSHLHETIHRPLLAHSGYFSGGITTCTRLSSFIIAGSC